MTHHGIKGQKWGVRNGPPYPLAPSAHSASEKKAGWQSSLNRKKETSYDKKFDGETGEQRAEAVGELFVAASVLAMTIGTMATVIATGKQVVSNILEQIKIDKYERFMEERSEKGAIDLVHSADDLPLKKAPGTIESDMAAANPNNRTVDGYQRNCMYCSTVYDLRRRGYDVTANSRLHGGYADEILKYYKGSKLESFEGDMEGALAALKSQPEGARGNLMGWGPLGGGHSVAYEIVNGNPRIIDAQTNKEWTWDGFSKYHGTDMYVVRTDNCEPNWDEIARAIDPACLNSSFKIKKIKPPNWRQ